MTKIICIILELDEYIFLAELN